MACCIRPGCSLVSSDVFCCKGECFTNTSLVARISINVIVMSMDGAAGEACSCGVKTAAVRVLDCAYPTVSSAQHAKKLMAAIDS